MDQDKGKVVGVLYRIMKICDGAETAVEGRQQETVLKAGHKVKKPSPEYRHILCNETFTKHRNWTGSLEKSEDIRRGT